MTTGEADLQNALEPSWNPLRCTESGLPANLTIMVKVLAIVLLLTNHVRLLPDPWLSFIPAIDHIPPLLFQRTLQVIFVTSAVAIVFNRRIRLSSVVLGSTLLLAIVSSKAYYGNNKTFCGLVLLLAGLYKPGAPSFLRWQLALTYFGAGLNKILDHDWQTGLFFEYWSVQRLHQQLYMTLNSALPAMFLARFMSWLTIVTELGVVPLLLIPRFYYWGALANILFQCGLLLFVGNTFVLFFYSMTAASFAFVAWPARPMHVLFDPAQGFSTAIKRFLQWTDVDSSFIWEPFHAGSSSNFGRPAGAGLTLKLIAGEKEYTGFRALRSIILFNPVTYFFIAAAVAVTGNGQGPALYRRILVSSLLILLMPPLAWCLDNFGRISSFSGPSPAEGKPSSRNPIQESSVAESDRLGPRSVSRN
jgi:hypothetical protein